MQLFTEQNLKKIWQRAQPLPRAWSGYRERKDEGRHLPVVTTKMSVPSISTRSSATAEREPVSYAHLFSAHSLIVHFTEHRICFTTINRLAKLVSTLSANKQCDIRTLSWIGHSRSFKVILVGAGRNTEQCVVIMCT